MLISGTRESYVSSNHRRLIRKATRVSYEWLKTPADLPQDPKDLERESRTGTEVEA